MTDLRDNLKKEPRRWRSRVLRVLSITGVLAVCAGGCLIAIADAIYRRGQIGMAGPLSDNFPVVVRALKEYAKDHDGDLPDAGRFFDELRAYVDTERNLYANWVEEPEKRFKAIPWEDEYGNGLLIYWSERPYGVPWRESYSHGLIVYEGVETGRVVLLLRTPDEPDFSAKWVRPKRLGESGGLDKPKIKDGEK